MNTQSTATTRTPLLKVSGLKKSYGAIQAVGGVDFEGELARRVGRDGGLLVEDEDDEEGDDRGQ